VHTPVGFITLIRRTRIRSPEILKNNELSDIGNTGEKSVSLQSDKYRRYPAGQAVTVIKV